MVGRYQWKRGWGYIWPYILAYLHVHDDSKRLSFGQHIFLMTSEDTASKSRYKEESVWTCSFPLLSTFL